MSIDRHTKPRLRQVEPVPLVVEGRQVIGLKDPLHMSDTMLCVSREAFPVLTMLDGTNSLLDIQADLSARSGRIVYMDDITTVVERLEEANLLEGERFREAFALFAAEYRAKPFRPSSHAGLSYSDDPDALRDELAGFFESEGGPGAPDFRSDPRRPVGLIAPHIDIRAGGTCSAHGYHALAAGQPSDVYVILGTGHAGVEQMFTATHLDFQTPLGTARTDRDLLGLLENNLGRDPAGEEILHASEHVIEFQVLFLQHLFDGKHEFTILPVLCSLSHQVFQDGDAFASRRTIFDQFCLAMREACAQSSKSVCFIASADLDHIGPRYGDSFLPDRTTVERSLEKDKTMLDALERVDVDEFVRQVATENDARRICGFSPITTMFHCMDAHHGALLHLDFAQVDDRNSFVSFTSMIFH